MDARNDFCGIFVDAVQELYQGSVLFHGARAFTQLCRELCAGFWGFFVFLIYFLCQVIPERRFLEVSASSSHALTSVRRALHAYIAPCGWEWSLGCSGFQSKGFHW